MKVEVTGAAPLEVEASVLAVPVFEEDVGAAKGLFAELDRRLDGHLAAAATGEEFKGKADQVLSLRTLGRLRAGQVAVVGLGKREAGEAALPRTGFEALRAAAGKVARTAQAAGASRLAFAAPRLPGQSAAEARAVVEGALLGAYRFERYKSE
jgi:leucyl aminopeptidase